MPTFLYLCMCCFKVVGFRKMQPLLRRILPQMVGQQLTLSRLSNEQVTFRLEEYFLIRTLMYYIIFYTQYCMGFKKKKMHPVNIFPIHIYNALLLQKYTSQIVYRVT